MSVMAILRQLLSHPESTVDTNALRVRILRG
jgi:hypothetical protein